ncbi:hypothetical protein BGX28_009206 [Mortierella sp. GBA30]|nr:hypothetical protein BGX28_009206 [Mortierella sp. GBA30]
MNTYVIGGFGHKVSEATIFAFMRRYGIDPAQICSPGKTKNPRSTDGSAKANGSAETNGPAKASIPQVDTNQKKITMVLGTGGETPEMRVDPSYTAKRRANFQQTIEDASARVIILARVDRTVIEVAQQYNIPIVHAMVRYEKDYGAINVAWGYDDAMKGYFLTISDSRLAWASHASEDVNNICYKVADDGAGRYFDMNTYRVGGFGHKVSEETIFTFMRRYKIDPDKIGTPEAVDVDEGPGGQKEHYDIAFTSPEKYLDPTYIKERKEELEKVIKTSLIKPAIIHIPRIDRTITELAEQHNIPILRQQEPPLSTKRTVFFYDLETYGDGVKECAYPDCRMPEMEGLVVHKRCARCKKVWYCSRTCQMADWKTHKAECQES